MNKIAGVFIMVLLANLFLSGCQTTSARIDSGSLRDEAKDYFTDEIMDNLVRAKTGEVILQVDVSDLNAVVETKMAATLSGSHLATNASSNSSTVGSTLTNTTSQAGTALPTVGKTVAGSLSLLASNSATVARNLSGSFQPERDNTLTFTGVPAISDEDAYRPYIEFVNLANCQDHLYKHAKDGPSDSPKKEKHANDDLPQKQWKNVKSAMFSADGQHVLTLSDDGAALWSTGTDKDPNATPEPHNGLYRQRPENIKSIVRADKPGLLFVPREGTFVPGARMFNLKDNYWYYVPSCYKDQYFELCMAIVTRTAKAKGSNAPSGITKTLPIQ